MAEVVAVASTVVTIHSLVNNSVELANEYRIAFGEERFDRLYWNWTEKRKYDAWANDMRCSPRAIPAKDEKLAKQIFAKSKDTYEEAREPLLTIPAKSAGEMTRRLWLMGGYDDLKSLSELIKALNETLIIAVPPLPAYSSESLGADVALRSQTAHGAIQESAKDPISQAAAKATQDQASDAQVTRQEDRVVFQLHETCVRIFSQLRFMDSPIRQRLGEIEDRLVLWGHGLFSGGLSLSILFAVVPVSSKHIRASLLSLLVDIAFTQGSVFPLFYFKCFSDR